jgi:predicted PurR-regulated permease PerM
MSLRWIFLVLLVAYGVSVFASVENFNEMIEQTTHEQNQLAAEIRSRLENTNEKTLEISRNESVDLKGSFVNNSN